jgi:predicted DNA-binding ribbon-helix-helix protein
MKRPQKRSLVIRGHRTSISLEEPFWLALKEVADAEGLTVGALVERIDLDRGATGLSSAIRVHLLAHFRGPVMPDDSDG